MTDPPRDAILFRMPLRSVLVDDSAHFLAAARDLLEREGLSVVGVGSTSSDAVRLTADLHPDLVLIDIDLGEESGFDCARRVAGSGDNLGPPVVLISAYPEGDFADLIAESPAIGFLPKRELSADRIREILAGTDNRGESSPG